MGWSEDVGESGVLMGTNYYYTGPILDTSHCEDGKLHIGKQSAGWAFIFHSQEVEGRPLRIVVNFKLLLGSHGALIEDEYGVACSYSEFWEMVERTKDRRQQFDYVSEGYCFILEDFS